MIFIQNHLGPQQELCCSWMEDIKREQEKGERVYSGALLNCRGLSSTSVGKHARVLLPRPSQFTSLDHFISRHTVTATCNETDNQWQISFTYSFKVGASYNIFVTEQDVSYIIFIHLHLHYIYLSICCSGLSRWWWWRTTIFTSCGCCPSTPSSPSERSCSPSPAWSSHTVKVEIYQYHQFWI